MPPEVGKTLFMDSPRGDVTAVIGLQWGDEAKGKLVDLMTDRHDIVVRYLGGNNAGHTVKFDGRTYKLSLLPAGVLRPGVKSVIASGTVINPEALLSEIAGVEDQGVEITGESLLISERAHVILPYHVAEDAMSEKGRGEAAIGTTGRGIGPCYRDKAGRSLAIRVGDLLHEDRFRQRLTAAVTWKNRVFEAFGADTFDAEVIAEEYLGYAEQLRPHVRDTVHLLHDWLDEGKSMLFEAAQGSLLDVDHGTFPYVTSSNSSGVGLPVGSGVPARAVNTMYGVVKAYSTRVGGGPFPTELHDEIGELIRKTGNEYGTVTGRPRRCGWLDTVATRYGARVSGVDRIGVMLLDVLDQLPEIQICEAYEIDGVRTRHFPADAETLERAVPIYRTLPGWQTDTTTCRTPDDLPAAARSYLETVSDLVGVPVALASVGPDREQTVWL